MATRTLMLVRHGQYVTDPTHPRSGALTALGRKQARRLAGRLAEYPVGALHVSTMPRAVETAELVGPALGSLRCRRTRLLLEGIPTALPQLPGLSRALVTEHRQRMDEAFERYFKPARGRDRYEVLVCHGNIIRYLLRKALGDPAHKWWRSETHNCSLSMVSIDADGAMRLLALNDVGHLPRSMQTVM